MIREGVGAAAVLLEILVPQDHRDPSLVYLDL
jgi:hypothetical protein